MCEIDFESYQIPPELISLIQDSVIFQGLENEDPKTDVKAFLTLCNIFNLNGVPHDAINRIIFPFSLRGQAMSWYDASRGSNIKTFEELQRRL